MLTFGDSYTSIVGRRSLNTSDKWQGQIVGHLPRQGSAHGSGSTEWPCNHLVDCSCSGLGRPDGSFDGLKCEIAWRRREMYSTTTTLGQVTQGNEVSRELAHRNDVRKCRISSGRSLVEPPRIPRESESCSSCANPKKQNANARC